MKIDRLVAQIREKQSFLCVGLDTDLEKIPVHLRDTEDPLFEFNKAIIDATADYCVAYKPNLAFYEAYGVEGWRSLERTIAYLNESYPNHFTIADAKRGDIGNTAERYAEAFYNQLGFDSVTLSPYMGSDAIEPFLKQEEKSKSISEDESKKLSNSLQKITDDFVKKVEIKIKEKEEEILKV